MKVHINRVFLFIFVALLSNNLALASKFKVTTSPSEADVYIRNSTSDTPQKIGVTPIDKNLIELKSQFNLGSVYTLTISKEGHESYNMMIASPGDAAVDISVNLPISQNVHFNRKIDKIAEQLFEVQRLTRDKAYDRAILIIEEIEKEEGSLSITSEMRAGIYYLKKDFQQALSFYRKAFALNSQNKDAYSMKLYLEQQLGLKP